jgi:tripartite-type tricarboxylate transporter receptor subunit TctC
VIGCRSYREADMTDFTRRAVLGGLSAFAVMPAFAEAAWPNRPIMLVVGFPAGGPTDIVGRIIAQALSQRLGQPVIVEDRPGASGTTAAGQVARARPDGYTLLANTSTYTASAALFRTLPFRPVEDFSTISTIVEFPYVLATYADHPARTIADLISAARSPSRNTPLTYGTSGIGSVQHLTAEQFARIANVEFQHIPFRGGAPAITELLGKRLDFVVDQPSALIDIVRDGRLRALAVTGEKRFFGLPEVQTISEAGFPGFVVTGWQGLVAPANLPAQIVNRLYADLTNVLADPAIVQQLKKLGNEPKPSTPDEFRSRLVTEIERWTKVIAAAKIERV